MPIYGQFRAKKLIFSPKSAQNRKNWGGGGKENFGKKTIGGAAFFLLLKYGGADRFHEKKLGGGADRFHEKNLGGLTDFMKKILGGLKAILTAEAGGAERFFGTEKNPFPGGFSGKFWPLPYWDQNIVKSFREGAIFTGK